MRPTAIEIEEPGAAGSFERERARDDRRRATQLWALLVFLLAATPLLNAYAVPPNFGSLDVDRVTTGEDEFTILYRLRGLVVLGALLGTSVHLLATGRARPGGHALFATGLVFSFMPLVSSYFGLEPALPGTHLVLPALLLAVFLLPPIPMERLGGWVKTIVRFYAYGALLGAFLWPHLVLQTGYASGWIPGLTIRLHGVGIHANGLAPLAVAYFLVRWLLDREKRVGFHDLAVLAVLVLAQSKISWATFLLTVPLALAQNRRVSVPWARWAVVSITLLMAVLMTDVSDSLGFLGKATGILPAADQSAAFTLTGRTQVWRETMYLWEQNPWFGYGPSLWGRDMQARYRDFLGWTPPAAHSQFYQTLGESGLVGVAALLAYVGTLVVWALWVGRKHPIATGFVVVLIARGITEQTLSATLEISFSVHFWALGFLVLAVRARRRVRERTRDARRETVAT